LDRACQLGPSAFEHFLDSVTGYSQLPHLRGDRQRPPRPRLGLLPAYATEACRRPRVVLGRGMRSRPWLTFVVASGLGLGVACGDGESDPEPTTTGGAGGDAPALPEAICVEGGSRYVPGAASFAEATSESGLDGVEGVRINAVDFDGDGFADLLVRRGADAVDEPTEGAPACCADRSCDEEISCPVRQTWLMRNRGDGTFEDVTHASGILQTRAPESTGGRPGSVWAFADVDNDGDLDAFSGVDDGRPFDETTELMINRGDGTFELGAEDNPMRTERRSAPASAVFVDVDRDGNIDLFVPHYRELNAFDRLGPQIQDRLYRGDGAGRFFDETDAAGLTTLAWSTSEAAVEDQNQARAHSNAWSGLACDLNGDGAPELLAASYGRAPNHLWQGRVDEGGVGFTNRSVESGYAYDDRQDWTDNESARCFCQLQPEADGCAGVPAPAIPCASRDDAFRWGAHATERQAFRLGGNTGATICRDVDNDGHLDLLTSEIVHWDVGASSDPSELLFNRGSADVTFERPGNEQTGLTRVRANDVVWDDGDITAAVFDFDNDGWADVYIGSTDYPGTRGLLYHQDTPRRFSPVALADGIDHNRSHGVAVADFDRDGDLDVVVGHSRFRCGDTGECYPTAQVRLFENRTAAGNWIQLHLGGGAGTNRAAIGARVTVAANDGTVQVQEVGGGHGHFGAQDDLTLHFGLGAACEAEVTVRWPDRALTEQSFTVVSGYRYEVEQGEPPRVEAD
ncbi:MAG: CRTAC1 family protein, partial [Myxococcota bacterium]